MKKLKLVKQLDKYGCTIACLSMITEISYFDVRKILHQEIDRMKNKCVSPTEIGLNCLPLKEALEKIFNIPCRFIKFLSFSKLKKHCILYICPLMGAYEFVHTIVFDAKNRRIIDPMDNLKNLNEFNIICCIEIQ